MDRQAGKLGCLKWELDGGLISRAQIKVHVVFLYPLTYYADF